MKSRILMALIVLATGCDNIRTVEIEQNATTIIEKGTIIEQFISNMGFGDFLNMDISQNQELKNSDIQKKFIEKARLTLLRLEITSPPQGQDFTFIDSLTFYVESPKKSKEKIAGSDQFDTGSTQVDMILEPVDISAHARDDVMNITTAASGRRPSSDTEIYATIRIEIVASIQ